MEQFIFSAAFAILICLSPLDGTSEDTANRGPFIQNKYFQFYLPPQDDPMTAEKANLIAERLVKEERDPIYHQALQLYSSGDYEGALKICLEAENSSNSMIIYLTSSTLFSLNYKDDTETRKVTLQEIVDTLQKACEMDNPYAMSRLDDFVNDYQPGAKVYPNKFLSKKLVPQNPENLFSRIRRQIWTTFSTHRMLKSSAMTFPPGYHGDFRGVENSWGERALDYWRLREYDDPESLFQSSVYFPQSEQAERHIRAALQGSVEALLSIMGKYNLKTGELDWMYDESEGSPGWRDAALLKMKDLADTGQPIAQTYYGIYTHNPNYIKQAAESGVYGAVSWLGSVHYRSGKDKKTALAKLRYTLMADLLNGNQYPYFLYRDFCWYRSHEDGTALYFTKAEYKEELAKVQKWLLSHPESYTYVTPSGRKIGPRTWCDGPTMPSGSLEPYPEIIEITDAGAKTLTLEGQKPKEYTFAIWLYFSPKNDIHSRKSPDTIIARRAALVTNTTENYSVTFPVEIFHPKHQYRLVNLRIDGTDTFSPDSFHDNMLLVTTMFELDFYSDQELTKYPLLAKDGFNDFFSELPEQLRARCASPPPGSDREPMLWCVYKENYSPPRPINIPLKSLKHNTKMALDFSKWDEK